jgi:hypothetical protein
MTPEQQLAQILGSLPTTQQEKLAASFSSMSIQQLREVLTKEAGVVKNKTKNSEMEKLSAIEKIALADEWGRSLARTHHEALVKAAAMPAAIGNMASRALGVGKKIVSNPAVKNVVGKGALAMGGHSLPATMGVGAAGGAALGALKKPEPGGSRIGGALRGAAMGAGVAGGAHVGLNRLQQSGGAAGKYLRSAVSGASGVGS